MTEVSFIFMEMQGETIQGLLDEYQHYRERYGYYSDRHDSKSANKNYVRAEKVIKRLKKIGSIESLYPLLSSENSYVRIGAAKKLLPIYEDQCHQVLSNLTESSNRLVALNAEMVWREWKRGALDPDK